VKPRYFYGAVAVSCVVLFGFAPSLCAQNTAAPRHAGVPQDWSDRHIVFSRDALAKHPELIYRERRVLHQVMQRWQAPNWGAFEGVDSQPAPAHGSGSQRDWNFALGSGRLSPHTFPAKYSFDPAAPPSCTNDYVVFGLDVPGTTGGQANLVGFNNLYVNAAGTGACFGLKAPTVMFAYNITGITTPTGKIVTSPTLSEDGTKIGFIESVSGATPSAIFHVLDLTTAGTGGTIAVSVAPAAGSMTSTIFSPTANSTTSWPWIDYGADIVYVGADNGDVYQITGVFKGTPALTGSPWPAVVVATHLSPPVLDASLGLLMVGSTNGNLYQIDTASATVLLPLPVGSGGTSSGIYAPAVVDITNGTTFVVSANDGSTGAVLVEAATATLGTTPPMSKAQIGLGALDGTTIHLYEPAFSNDYYTNPASGVITLCGTGASDTSPSQFAFGFTGTTMSTLPAPGYPVQLSASATDRCTGWTEFFNPNVGSSFGTDFFFFGLSGDCTFLGGTSTTGCVVAISSDPAVIPTVTAAVETGPTAIVVDNYSTAIAASNIYLCASGIDTAYKFTQDGLN